MGGSSRILRNHSGLAALGAAGSGSTALFEEFVYPGGFVACTPLPRRCFANHTAFSRDHECRVAGGVRRYRSFKTYGRWYRLRAGDCCGYVFKRDLVCVGHKARGYSPGVITGVMIYVPLAVYGYSYFVRLGEASIGAARIGGRIGDSYHL
jgi:hypothetical protein